MIAQRPGSAVRGEGATQNGRSGETWEGKSIWYFVYVAVLAGIQDCLHSRDASGCHGRSSYSANRCLPHYVCEVAKNRCIGLGHQIVQTSAYPPSSYRAPLDCFFGVCIPR